MAAFRPLSANETSGRHSRRRKPRCTADPDGSTRQARVTARQSKFRSGKNTSARRNGSANEATVGLFGSPLARTGAGVTLCVCVVSLLIRSHGGAGSISLTCRARRALKVDFSRLLLECSRFLGAQLAVHVDLAATMVSTMLQKDSSDSIKTNQARAREQISKWSVSCLRRNRLAGAEICGNQQPDAHSV